jgi:KRAB domain-containing zinc finger protein
MPKSSRISAGKYQCNRCFEQFKTASGLDYHRQTESECLTDLNFESAESPFNKEFVSSSNLSNSTNTNTNNDHQNNEKFKCDQCGKYLSSTYSLNIHIDSVHDKTRYSCDVEGCNKSYSSKKRLSTHIKAMHEGEGYRCEQCDKNFSRKAQLTIHLTTTLIHSNERQFVCSVDSCGKLFTTKINLNQHVRSLHEGVRHSCIFADCAQTFAGANGLKQHISSIHELTRYRCNLCDKSYGQRGDLNVHIKKNHYSTIQTITPTSFNCLHCDATVATFALLRTHTRTHHRLHIGGFVNNDQLQ